MHFTTSVGSALTLAVAFLSATPAVAQPHGAKHLHPRGRVGQPKSTSASKRGLVYNDCGALQPFAHGKASSWAYNWESAPKGQMPAGTEYVPMCHGSKPEFTTDFHANMKGFVAAGSVKHVLAFNEPDMEQVMSPGEAVAAYKEHLMPYKQLQLGSPGVTSVQGNPGQGLGWLEQFISQCSGCKIDFVPIHWYGSPGQNDNFKEHVKNAAAMIKKYPVTQGAKLWLTEFGLTEGCDMSAHTAFISDAVPFLDSQPAVERYSYFKADAPLTSGGSMSPAGTKYAA